MGMDAIELIYLVCFFLGLGFAIVSGLLSGVFSGGGEGHVDVGHGDAGADLGGHADTAVHFSPLSPVVLATFISTFGGAGYIFRNLLHWPAYAHLPLAGVSGFAVGGAVFLVFYKLFAVTQASSHARPLEMIGLEAQVTVPIPHDGLGEITYTVGGMRFTGSARTADGKELPAHALVKIQKQVGNAFVVQKAQ
jgi:hypothetical protein